MKLPQDATIDPRKITDYLLVPLAKSDKSRWLARGGYTEANPDRLLDDLRRQILPLDAIPSRTTPFGESFEIYGELIGPSGRPLAVRTVWLKHALSSRFHFVTLMPSSNLPK